MTTKKTDPFAGTSLLGELTATKAQITAALGEPTYCYADQPADWLRKSIYVWDLRTQFGPISIYDWKEEDQDFGDDDLIVWSIGGRANSYKNLRVHPALTFIRKEVGCNVRQIEHGFFSGNRRQQQEVAS